MVVVPHANDAQDDVQVLFLEPARHTVTLENWPEYYGRYIVLVDLKTALAGLP